MKLIEFFKGWFQRKEIIKHEPPPQVEETHGEDYGGRPLLDTSGLWRSEDKCCCKREYEGGYYWY